jgi:integrase
MIRKRNGYWQVRVYAGLDPLTRRPRYEYDRAPTRKLAEQAEARLITEVAEGRRKGANARTVADLLDRWLPWHIQVNERSLGTGANYRHYIERKIKPALGPLPVRRLDPETLDTFYGELLARGGTARVCVGTDPRTGKKRYATRPCPLSPSTVRGIHAVLSGALEQAVKWGWISHNPARLATKPAARKAKVSPPTVDQVATLLEAALATELRFGLFLRMAVILGARRSELCALRWSHVDFDRGEILIERGVTYVPGASLVDADTKDHGKRRLAADPRTMELLRAHRVACAKVALELGASLPADAYVFSYAPEGSTPMHPNGATHKFKRLARKHGLDERSRLHDLRHFMVTNALDGGVALPTVAGRAGHSDGGRVTLATYAHWQRAQDRHAAELLAKLCDGAATAGLR